MLIQDAKTIEIAEEFEQACKDGIRNIAPIIALMKMNPQELKKELPKSVWKKLCKNSYTHNRLIYQSISKLYNIMRYDEIQTKIQILELVSEIPYTLWKTKNNPLRVPYITNNAFKFLRTCSDLPLNELLKNEKSISWYNKYEDTLNMANRLNQPFNPQWTPRRMQEEHDRLVILSREEFNRKRANKDAEYAKKLAIDFRTLHRGIETFEHKGVKITPLVNMTEVQAEGTVQGHCVGNYAEACADGDYLVYSLEDSDGIKSTLGIDVNIQRVRDSRVISKKKSYSFSQHYLRYNKPVTNHNTISAASEIIKRLNEANQGKDKDGY